VQRSAALTSIALALLLAACGSSHAARSYGVVHTRIGDATVRCGGGFTHTCDDEAALVFANCTDAYERSVAPLKQSLTPPKLDHLVRTLVGHGPPMGARWTDIRCGAKS
jgi:hypothetical protein